MQNVLLVLQAAGGYKLMKSYDKRFFYIISILESYSWENFFNLKSKSYLQVSKGKDNRAKW